MALHAHPHSSYRQYNGNLYMYNRMMKMNHKNKDFSNFIT